MSRCRPGWVMVGWRINVHTWSLKDGLNIDMMWAWMTAGTGSTRLTQVDKHKGRCSTMTKLIFSLIGRLQCGQSPVFESEANAPEKVEK